MHNTQRVCCVCMHTRGVSADGTPVPPQNGAHTGGIPGYADAEEVPGGPDPPGYGGIHPLLGPLIGCIHTIQVVRGAHQ